MSRKGSNQLRESESTLAGCRHEDGMDKFCRICSRSDEFQKFELSTISQISNIRIDDMLVYCTQQQIMTGDSLPQHICAECFTALNSAFVFRKLTYHSENGFRQMININLTASEPMPSSIVLEPEIINSNLTASDLMSSSIVLENVPLEMTDHILPDVSFKEDDELEEPLAAPTIIPVELSEALAIRENLISTSDDPTADDTESGKRRRGSRNVLGATTYICKDCGYTTQNKFNFKRHQSIQKHSNASKIVTRHPLHIIKHLIQPFIKTDPKTSKLPKQLKQPKQKLRKTEKKTQRKRARKGKSTLYRCDDCGYQNYIGFNFRRHQKTWNHTRVTVYSEPEATATSEDMLKCRDCGKQFPSNTILKAHRNNECQSLANNLDSDYVCSEETLQKTLGIKKSRSQRRNTAAEPMVTIKTEPMEDEPPSAGQATYDGEVLIDYGENLIKKE